MSEFLLRPYNVTVDGWPDVSIAYAHSRGSALADVWRSYCSAYPDTTFKRWLKIARVRVSEMTPPNFGKPITADGKKGFFISQSGNEVKFAYANGKSVCHIHELDCEGLPTPPEKETQ